MFSVGRSKVDESLAGGDGRSSSVVRPRAFPCESRSVASTLRRENVESLSLATVLTVSKAFITTVDLSASLQARDAVCCTLLKI